MRTAIRLLLLAGLGWAQQWANAADVAPVVPVPDAALVQRGAYLAVAGDCVACHSTAKGKPYAGGLLFQIPLLGTVYSSNITPDVQTGIGRWTLADFDRALRKGVSKDGHFLYPAMPYVSYAKTSDEDVAALYAYFMHGVAPVAQSQQASTIPWPLNMRWPLAIWNWLFLPDRPYQPKTNQSAEWNRGAYLVQGLAHCGTCHTPRGVAMQEKALDESTPGFLSGAKLAGWDAYNITSHPQSGIGGWTQAQLAQYLQTGSVPSAGPAAGPMSEAIEHSFSHMAPADIQAIATYLRSVPAVGDSAARPRNAWGAAASDVAQLRGGAPQATPDAAQLYLGNCASCHQAQGTGTADGYYPSLLHNSTLGADGASNLVQVILHGVQRKTPKTDVLMPGFAADLSDAQIAALANYLTRQFGNPAAQVSEGDVKKLR